VHIAPPETLNAIMSTRFQHIQADGDKSDMSSALEMAIDSHWCIHSLVVRFPALYLLIPPSTIFLSSSEAQDGMQLNPLLAGSMLRVCSR
jgi:hypothetical protein